MFFLEIGVKSLWSVLVIPLLKTLNSAEGTSAKVASAETQCKESTETHISRNKI